MIGYREHVVVLKNDLPNAKAEAMRLTTQQPVNKDLLYGVRRALALHETALQQRSPADPKNRERLLTDKAAIDIEP